MSMTIRQAIRCLHLPDDHLKNYEEYGIGVDDELREAMLMAIVALREKAERDDPKPLTYKELLQMHGEPVWLHTITDPRPHRCGLLLVEIAEIRTAMYCTFWAFGNECEITRNPDEYGRTWICYRHKPKEEK